MLQGDSAVLGADAVAAAASGARGTHDGGDTAAPAVASSAGGGGGGGVGSSNSGDDENKDIREEDSGERSFGGNRWPRQETLALLRIRSDMDVAFRDATVKGPLWEEVSRKLAELGYHRSAKKCKEKFENVYKYHKRTKDGRSGKSDGKTYRFFDQLEALESNHQPIQSPNPSRPPQSSALPAATPASSLAATSAAVTLPTTTATTVPMPPVANTINPGTTVPHVTTVPSTITLPMVNLTIPSSYLATNPTNFTPSSTNPTPLPFPNIPTDLLSNSSSSSTSSDDTLEEGRRKRKRKWKDFFQRLMKEVVEKQEQLQKRFLEAIEKREHERTVREEAWRMQEMQRINREREILAQERSIAAAKDAAVMAFLQKIAEQQNLGQALSNINFVVQPSQQQSQPVVTPAAPPPVQQPPEPPVLSHPPQQQFLQPGPHAQPVMPLAPPQQQQQEQQQQVTNREITKGDNGESFAPAASSSSSRWPKVEVQALINLRTSLDAKYQENGPKGPLWEEISAEMKRIGYNRSAKRCKEKWENINKYFKKVKESNKKRPEDSKTCPYFHQLDALYRKKNKVAENPNQLKTERSSSVMMAAPLMVQPEQQWPPRQDAQQPAGPEMTMEEAVGEEDKEGVEEDDDDKEGEEEDEEEDEGGGDGNYEIVASKSASVGASAE